LKGQRKAHTEMRIVKPVCIEVVGGNGYRMKVVVRDMEHRMSAI
jgi:hypothetical protein